MLLGNFNAVWLLASSEGGAAPNPLEFNADLALWTLFIFLGLLAVLTKYAWKPIIEGLNQREKSIADNIASAESVKQQAETQLASYESKMAGASDEAAAVVAEARKDAILTKEKIMADAAMEAQRTRDRAMADIEAAKNAAVRELAESSVDSAVALAGSIVGRSLDKKDHSDLIEKSMKQFGSGA